MKSRKTEIKNLEIAIEHTKSAIRDQKTVLGNLESRLEAQRSEMNYQRMLLKFDAIDELRQEIANCIAVKQMLTSDGGHINELEANDKL